MSAFSSTRLLEVTGEQSLHGLVITADRGYGSMQLIRSLLRHGIGSIMIMPEHLLRCHPFVGKSYFSVTRNDEDEGIETDEEDNDVDQEDDDVQNVGTDPGKDLEGEETAVQVVAGMEDTETKRVDEIMGSGPTRVVVLDRRRSFVIDDSPNVGDASFLRPSP